MKKLLLTIAVSALTLSSAFSFDFRTQKLISLSGKLIITNNSIVSLSAVGTPYLDNSGTNVVFGGTTNITNPFRFNPYAFRFGGLFTDGIGQTAQAQITVVTSPWTNGIRPDQVLATNLISIILQSGIIVSNAQGGPAFLGGTLQKFTYPASNGVSVYSFPLNTNFTYAASTVKVLSVTNAMVETAPGGTNWQVEIFLSGWAP